MSKTGTGAGNGLRAIADAMSKLADEAHPLSETGAGRLARALADEARAPSETGAGDGLRAIADAMSKLADAAGAP